MISSPASCSAPVHAAATDQRQSQPLSARRACTLKTHLEAEIFYQRMGNRLQVGTDRKSTRARCHEADRGPPSQLWNDDGTAITGEDQLCKPDTSFTATRMGVMDG